MSNEGESIDNPKIVNLKEPLLSLTLHTPSGPVKVNMQRFADAAKQQGISDIRKGDVISIGAIRNAKNQWVPDYDSIKLERAAEVVVDDE